MIYTDGEYWSQGERTCLYSDCSGPRATAWCGHRTKTDRLTAVETLAQSLERFLRQEDNLCTNCVNEMARELGIPGGQRRRWVEDYAGGELAEHVYDGQR